MRSLGALLLGAFPSTRSRMALALLALAPAAAAQTAPPGPPHGPQDSSSFAPADFLDAPALIEELGAQSNLVSAFLWSRFSPAVKQRLADAGATLSARVAALVEGLDSVLEGDALDGEACFAGVPLSPETRILAAQAPQGSERVRLNRLLLEDAYRAELRRSPPPSPVPPSGTAVSTEQADYAPGSTAHIRGRGFLAGETVHLQVMHADGTPDEGEDHEPWSVVAGAGGGFQAAWHVCEDDCLGSTLRLTATGETSARTAQVLFTDAAGTPTFQRLASLGTPSPGAYLYAGLLQGADGALYGTAYQGGSVGYGTVFKLDTDGSHVTVLKSFDHATTGGYPFAELIQGTDGALYGTASQGGSSGGGTVFRLNTDGTGFAVLQNFEYSTTGGALYSALLQGNDGALYGAAYVGGSGGYGTLFKLNTDGTGFTVLENFDYTTGGYPYGGALIQGTDGALYGAASQGGISGYGAVFTMNTDGTGFTVLQNLDYSTTGGYLYSGLMQGADGALYGTASQGGSSSYGTVFTLNTDGTGFTVLQNLDYSTTGAYIYTGLLQATDGALYGLAHQGGSSGSGTVFKLDTDGTDFTVLQNLDQSTTGGYPYGDELIQGTDGVLYGTVTQGGPNGVGVVFHIDMDGTDFDVLRSFSFNAQIVDSGGYPYSGLLQGASGTLFGLASQGGSGGFGTVFELNANGTDFALLKDLDFTTGGYPFGGALIQGTDDALYGATTYGGSGSNGTVFKLNADGSGFAVLQNFDYYTTGGSPYARLIQGTDGALYGATANGGSSSYGVVFRLNPDGTGFAVLKNFDYSSTGAYLYSGLMQGADGALYGTAYQGGASGYGTVFRLNTDGSGFALLQSFDYSTSGAYPYFSGLAQRADGVLYGTTYQGGSSGYGTLYQLDPDGTDFSVLVAFDSFTTGAYPAGTLMCGADGNLYGTTSQGGEASAGTVFRLVFDSPPVADAGADFSVNEGQLVTLDGSGSGPDPEALTYAWEQLPGGAAVTLSGADTDSPSFTAPFVALGGETLSFQLTVTAGAPSATDTVSVTVVNVNHPPVADAGLDQTLAEGSPVTLHGEDSFDIDSDAFSFAWVQVGGSPSVSLAGADGANPTLTAPYVGSGGAPGVVATLVFELQVDDGYPPDAPAPGYTFANVVDSVTIEITNLNNAPTAAAGADQTVDEHTAVVLDGTASSDPDSDPLSFAWAQVGGPSVALAGGATATPSFTAPFVGPGGVDLTFALTVDDDYFGLATDTVVVHVQSINDPPHATAARPTTTVLWPPNHGLVAVGIVGVCDPDGNATITITGVTQDEPTSGLGDGDTPIDAVINGDGTVFLRAERSGNGNGRVYHIHFIASDPEGSASGVVTVSVPHQKKSLAIDGGELHVSTH